MRGAEGACKNSQAKGPVLDDTLESKISANFAPKKQSLISRGEAIYRRIFQVRYRGSTLLLGMLPLFI